MTSRLCRGVRVPKKQGGGSRCIPEEPVNWADGFVAAYNISDRMSFLHARSIARQIKEAREESCEGNKQDLCKIWQLREEEEECCFLAKEDPRHFLDVSAAEDDLELSNLLLKLICHVMENLRNQVDHQQNSSSKSVAKLINNVFGKSRKSV